MILVWARCIKLYPEQILLRMNYNDTHQLPWTVFGMPWEIEYKVIFIKYGMCIGRKYLKGKWGGLDCGDGVIVVRY